MRRRLAQHARWMLSLLAACVLLEHSSVLAQVRSPRARSRSAELAPPPTFSKETRDVFFADALKALGPRDQARPNSSPTPADMPPTADPNLAAGWSQLISAETIEDEVKELSINVDTHVRSSSHFRSTGYQAARRDFTSLAALFGMIEEFDGPVRWKEQAPLLRNPFGRAGQHCKAGSDATFREATARAQQVRDLVRGGRPAEAAEKTERWSDTIDRAGLMLRMEVSADERLGAWLTDARGLERHQKEIVHEAEVLAALAKVIQREGYEFAGDETYRGYAQVLEQACQQLRQAAPAKDAKQAQAALKSIRVSCEKCHADYRG